MSAVQQRATHLLTVTATDWTMLRALARRVLCVDPASSAATFRHPSNDEYWDLLRDVQRSATRLAGYITSGELAVVIAAPDAAAPDEDEAEVLLCFDDGLEPIVVPWGELDFALEPIPRLR
ncbi:MAG: hypothetical protein NTZ21_20585 [Actinobacteria bacterium]|nr:hypothetical protein [Actinomycetota bacterium]